jgi:hypothetical protein
MKVYALTKITCFVKNPLIDTYHFTMFHGWAVRGSHPDEDVSYFLSHRLELPLKLYLNTFRLGDVIQPRLNLLVRDTAIGEMRKQPNVEFLKCVTAGVCQMPYREGDFSHWDSPDYFDDGDQPRRMLLEAVQSPKPGEAPTYYELICPDLDRIAGTSRVKKVTVTFPSIKETIEIPVARAAFNQFPLIWHDGCFLFSQELFEQFQSKLNWNYFVCTSVDLE